MTLMGFAQKPKNGTYIYNVAFAEWQGASMGATVTVQIKGDSIIVRNHGGMTGEKGEIIDAGIIMRHKKTGKWIIGHTSKDRYAEEIGGCTDGPIKVDFKRKKVWLC